MKTLLYTNPDGTYRNVFVKDEHKIAMEKSINLDIARLMVENQDLIATISNMGNGKHRIISHKIPGNYPYIAEGNSPGEAMQIFLKYSEDSFMKEEVEKIRKYRQSLWLK